MGLSGDSMGHKGLQMVLVPAQHRQELAGRLWVRWAGSTSLQLSYFPLC